jgi:DNA-directed RNA polymerase specialized sigma24 family protein
VKVETDCMLPGHPEVFVIGDLHRLSLEDIEAIPANFVVSDAQSAMLIALDDALRYLEEVDKGLIDLVECRVFGAMSIADTATALGLSPATVKRHWTLARAWLYREIQARGAG